MPAPSPRPATGTSVGPIAHPADKIEYARLLRTQDSSLGAIAAKTGIPKTLSVPRSASAALTSEVARPAFRRDDHQSSANRCSAWWTRLPVTEPPAEEANRLVSREERGDLAAILQRGDATRPPSQAF